MNRENVSALVAIVVIILLALVAFSLSSCSHYTEARFISKYNAPTHTDHMKPVPYKEFNSCVLGHGLTDNLER